MYNKCLNWDGKNDAPGALEPKAEILQFASKFNIPHQQKLCSVAIPTWCAHCGHLLPLGRKVNFKCEECNEHWHDRCDASICKSHCGLNARLIETYLDGIEAAKERSAQKAAQSKTAPEPLPFAPLSPLQNSKCRLPEKMFIEDFTLHKCIGKGNFGKVMLASHKDDPETTYAIKMLKKYSIVENEEFASVRTEKKIFQLVSKESFPFLVQAHAFFQDEHRIYFVMEFVEGGDLMFHVQNRGFSLSECKFYLAEIVLALEFLHSRGILYRDLKLDNILLSRDGHIKLADYGLSRCDMTAEGRTNTFCGTPEFMAPEMLQDQPYGFAVDFWAFGVLVYQVLENRSPFYGNTEREIFRAILTGKYEFLPGTDKHGRSLITKLLQPNPQDRLGIKDGLSWHAIKSHPFFSEVDWEALRSLAVPPAFIPEIKGPVDVSNFDEIFTSENVILTPNQSFILAKDGLKVDEAIEAFSSL